MTSQVTTTKPWYQSKTIWLNVIAVAVFVVTGLGAMPGIDPSWAPWFGFAVAVLNFVLRMITNQPIAGSPGDKAHPGPTE